MWRRILTDAFGHRTCRANSDAGSAYGAALLAGVGGGVWPDVESACAATIKTGGALAPNAQAAKAYDAAFALYRDLYPALKPLFPRLAALGGA